MSVSQYLLAALVVSRRCRDNLLLYGRSAKASSPAKAHAGTPSNPILVGRGFSSTITDSLSTTGFSRLGIGMFLPVIPLVVG
jgi:hypothetical protein